MRLLLRAADLFDRLTLMTAAFHPASPAATSSAGLLSIEQAHQAIAQLLNPLGPVTGIEQLALLDAQGRVPTTAPSGKSSSAA